ncbi:MAG: hypothetical protein RLZZ76_599, partial [Candidatus Parcubacteria bacterium]
NISALILSFFFILFVPVVQGFQDFTQTVDIMLKGDAQTDTYTIEINNASSTPLNAIEFELAYNPEELTITDIVSHGVLCEKRFIITDSIDNTKGQALFQCGTVTPFSNATGTIATIYTKKKTAHFSTLAFGETTHVLAHDGYGTDATRDTLVLQ